jgi:hypothetical protein
MRLVLGLAILVAQVGSVAYAHFGPAAHGQSWVRKTLDGCSAEPVACRRYFAWAPNDYAVKYRLKVRADGRTLTFAEALRRYHLPPSKRGEKAYWEDPPQRLIDTIKAYEESQGGRATRSVVLRYSVNGGARHEWRWVHG